VRPNADPCVSSDTENFDWTLEWDAGMIYSSPREEQLSFERDKYETWPDTAATPPESDNILIARMESAEYVKSSFIEAYDITKVIADTLDLLSLRR
jgi:hypothetical protein